MPIAAGSHLNFTSVSTVSVAEAKANFSAILRGVETKHSPVTILRRGVPVAQIIPVPDQPPSLLRGSMAGTARILGDIVSPLGVEWTVNDKFDNRWRVGHG